MRETALSKRFNPRAPCGARPVSSFGRFTSLEFQSTRPVRGATLPGGKVIFVELFQSTRPVRGATVSRVRSRPAARVSIHAPRAGRDLRLQLIQALLPVSIHAPRAGRDLVFSFFSTATIVSIHAPRAGRDGSSLLRLHPHRCFNPRAPCGARPVPPHHLDRLPQFQSTRPVRGATLSKGTRAERQGGFNPRAPCGARPAAHIQAAGDSSFNPRAPCGARRRLR